jgi:hypothetical protein
MLQVLTRPGAPRRAIRFIAFVGSGGEVVQARHHYYGSGRGFAQVCGCVCFCV